MNCVVYLFIPTSNHNETLDNVRRDRKSRYQQRYVQI